MRFLVDAQISPKFAKWLDSISGIEGRSLAFYSLQFSDDIDIFNFALENDFIIISKDRDFLELNILYGGPPKIVLLETGNTSTRFLIDLFSEKIGDIKILLINNDVLVVK
ncbi:MAG: hypothetical protein Kapaf2KO_04970 [Candidatus Kapaibacteriales bacterium]